MNKDRKDYGERRNARRDSPAPTECVPVRVSMDVEVEGDARVFVNGIEISAVKRPTR